MHAHRNCYENGQNEDLIFYLILHLWPSNFQEILILSINKAMPNFMDVSQKVEMPRPGFRYLWTTLYMQEMSFSPLPLMAYKWLMLPTYILAYSAFFTAIIAVDHVLVMDHWLWTPCSSQKFQNAIFFKISKIPFMG